MIYTKTLRSKSLVWVIRTLTLLTCCKDKSKRQYNRMSFWTKWLKIRSLRRIKKMMSKRKIFISSLRKASIKKCMNMIILENLLHRKLWNQKKTLKTISSLLFEGFSKTRRWKSSTNSRILTLGRKWAFGGKQLHSLLNRWTEKHKAIDVRTTLIALSLPKKVSFRKRKKSLSLIWRLKGQKLLKELESEIFKNLVKNEKLMMP